MLSTNDARYLGSRDRSSRVADVLGYVAGAKLRTETFVTAVDIAQRHAEGPRNIQKTYKGTLIPPKCTVWYMLLRLHSTSADLV